MGLSVGLRQLCRKNRGGCYLCRQFVLEEILCGGREPQTLSREKGHVERNCTRRVSLAENVIIPDRRAQGSPSMAVRKDMAPPDGPKFHGIEEDSTSVG